MPLYDPTYSHREQDIVQEYVLGTSNTICYTARDIRREHTGIHARVAISANAVTLAWTNFNIERDEDRVRLANSAYTAWSPGDLDGAEWPKTSMKKGLDLFCEGLWDESISLAAGGLMGGDPSIPTARLLVGNAIVIDGGTIGFAPPGTGKSYTAMGLAVSCMWGLDRVWAIGDAQLPLYVNVERSQQSMAARLARVNVALGLEPETPLPFLNARGRTLSDIYEAAKRTIAKEGCTWVIYDSISRAGAGSMVADDVANKICDMLNSLSPTWFALAHSPRADDTHAFGSQMFDAAADVTVQIKSQTSADGTMTGVGMEIAKANDLPKGKMAVHVLEWNADGLRGIRRGRVEDFEELADGERKPNEYKIADYLDRNGAASGSRIADDLGMNRSLVARILTTKKQFVFVRREGKESLYGHVLPSNTYQ